MVLDKVDKNIISILKKEERSTMTNLMVKTFAREGQKVFRNRLRTLESNNIITIRNMQKWGRSYSIELTERFK